MRQKSLRRFWYAVMPVADLRHLPRSFRLLGEDIVRRRLLEMLTGQGEEDVRRGG